MSYEFILKGRPIELGDAADIVLEKAGRPLAIIKEGADQDGLVVLWRYPGYDLRLKRVVGKDKYTGEEVSAYAVQEIIKL